MDLNLTSHWWEAIRCMMSLQCRKLSLMVSRKRERFLSNWFNLDSKTLRDQLEEDCSHPGKKWWGLIPWSQKKGTDLGGIWKEKSMKPGNRIQWICVRLEWGYIFYNAYNVPHKYLLITVLSTLQALIHLILAALWSRYYYQHNFTNGEI